MAQQKIDSSQINLNITSPLSSTSFIPTGTAIPTNGLYLPSANTIGISTNSALKVLIDPSGDIVIPKVAGTGMKVDIAAPTYPWQDLLSQIVIRGAGTQDPTFSVFRGNIRAYQFALNDEFISFIHMPHDYAPGTDVFFHVHWAHTSTGVTSGGITWTHEISYAKGHNQAAFSAPITPTPVAQAASNTQYQHMIYETQISTTGGSGTLLNNAILEPDGLLLIRTVLTANNMTGTPAPFAFMADMHYQSTNIGTKQKSPNFYI